MIAIDANILVRYLVRDDPDQARRAKKLLQETLSADEPGLVTIATLVELGWVLGKAYKIPADEVRQIVSRLLDTPQIVFEQSAVVQRALALELSDLADAIIHEAGRESGCDKTLTFDRNFARIDGVELLGA